MECAIRGFYKTLLFCIFNRIKIWVQVTSECCSPPKSLYYSEEELGLVSKRPLPRHVAIIMDGNRRWVKTAASGVHVFEGHWAGAEVLSNIVEAASDLGLKVLTVFGFSTENWGRSPEEIDTLLEILHAYLEGNRRKMVEQGVRFNVIGELSPFPSELKKSIEVTRQATLQGDKIDFVVALNYGGRDEIRRTSIKLAKEILSGRLAEEEITEEVLARYFDTAPFGDPDLLIRTSGERRISNFLLWQLAYTEIYITETLWPEFTARDLLNAVLDFQKRQRRRGK